MSNMNWEHTGTKGVYLVIRDGMSIYYARATFNNTTKMLGVFSTIEEASNAVELAILEHKKKKRETEKLSLREGRYKTIYPKLYQTWSDMKQRCYNEKCKNYKYYGAKGVVVCEEWKHSSNAFCEWGVANNWKEGLELDRIDVYGNYEPNNCQFITHSENMATGKSRIRSHNKTGYNGVRLVKGNAYVVEIYVNKKMKTIGYFKDIDDAIKARISAEIEYFGEQKTNFHYNPT